MALRKSSTSMLFCGISVLFFLFFVPSIASTATITDGSSTVTIDIPVLLKISNVENLKFNAWNGSGDYPLSGGACVYSNDSTHLYKVSLWGNGGTAGASAFQVKNGTFSIPYDVSWIDSSVTAAITAKGTLSSRAGAATAQDCSGGTNASFKVKFTEADLRSVPQGYYTGTLTIVVMSP